MNTTTILALAMLTPQNAAVTLNDIAGKSFDELVPLLGKPISARDQRGIGEWRTFKSPFKTSTSIVAFRKSEELIPGQIQVVFPKSVTDWKVALKAVAIDPKGGKLNGTQITGLSTKWNPFWDSQERVLSINVSAATIASATKRIVANKQIVSEKPLDFLALCERTEEAWITAYGKPVEALSTFEPLQDREFEHEDTKARKKVKEWYTHFARPEITVGVRFRGVTRSVGKPWEVTVHGKVGQSLPQILQAAPLSPDMFTDFARMTPNGPDIAEAWSAKTKDGKWTVKFSTDKNPAKGPQLTMWNLEELKWGWGLAPSPSLSIAADSQVANEVTPSLTALLGAPPQATGFVAKFWNAKKATVEKQLGKDPKPGKSGHDHGLKDATVSVLVRESLDKEAKIVDTELFVDIETTKEVLGAH